ncbi:MAG: esterase family protein [Acidobacteriota bacterium]|nr:esterase family protein [Acidobacteriota bacterium]
MPSPSRARGALNGTGQSECAHIGLGKGIVWVCALLVAAFAWPCMANAQEAVYETVQFKAAHLGGKRVSFNLILPRDYASHQGNFPVLYLLHGYAGNYTDWVRLTGIARYACAYEEIIVMPDAENGWYVNNYADPSMQWESYVIDDLIPYVDSHYRTVAERGGRAIAGLSMGGYGALYLGLKYRNLFSAVASLSGVVASAELARRDPEVWKMIGEKMPKMKKTLLDDFGPLSNPARKREDPFRLIRALAPQERPALFFAIGESDPFLQENRKFAALLSSLKIPYRYREVPGGHEWKVWDEEIQPVLALEAPIIGAR